MQSPLPTNDDLTTFSQAIPWQAIEQQKRRFNDKVNQLVETITDDTLPLGELSEATGVEVSTLYDANYKGNVLLANVNGHQHMLASFVSKDFRYGKPVIQSIKPYNFNPSVNHTNLDETDTPEIKMRALGAELELGLYREDGTSPAEEDVQAFINAYKQNAHRLGITPQVDREACRYQVEVHIAPGIGYHRMRKSLDGIMSSLVVSSQATNLNTAIFSAYPILSDFALTPDPKVDTAVAVMQAVNTEFPEYVQRLTDAKARYEINSNANFVETFRIQGCHIHLDIAGRSEALGLFAFYTMLRSASAIANKAVLKGGPFVNGTCDAELLCTREHLRRTTVTGRYIEMPVSPHLIETGLQQYGSLILSERANATARALLYDEELGQPVSVMHNPIGRIRPDLGGSRRICTLESTGLPVNISASRQAAILSDFEFTQVLIENYFRQYGCDLEPLYNDKQLWSILGPLDTEQYISQQDLSDRVGTDMTLTTATGEEITLAEFYEMKRLYMHQNLLNIIPIAPREIDDVYMSLGRMLNPPSKRVAKTVEEYIHDPACRSTGNWGKILRNTFVDEGGTVGSHDPDAVLRVANRVHRALVKRYST